MTIGILGNGQLAQMLNEAARSLNLECLCLPTEDISNLPKLSQFFSKIRYLTFENEFIDVKAIQNILKSTPHSIDVFPSLESIAILQNKIEQKKLLLRLNIKTASPEFNLGAISDDDLTRWVFKWATFGYDGKGTLLSSQTRNALKDFVQLAREKNTAVFAEEKISFTKELAMVGARNQEGEFGSYPLVISVQKNGICDTVYGPAHEFSIPTELQEKAQKIVRQIAEDLNYVGVLAVEFFLSHEGELFVNEIAPRVHNSGHYTLLYPCSQFENHIRAVAHIKLGSTQTDGIFAMKNIVGKKPSDSQFKNETGFYDYQKSEVRPGRKMGHVNFKGMGEDFKKFCLTLSTQE